MGRERERAKEKEGGREGGLEGGRAEERERIVCHCCPRSCQGASMSTSMPSRYAVRKGWEGERGGDSSRTMDYVAGLDTKMLSARLSTTLGRVDIDIEAPQTRLNINIDVNAILSFNSWDLDSR
jgi:hypothetical protein